MKTVLQVLSEEEKAQVHERTLKILSETGVKVNTEKGRQILADAGASVDKNTDIVKIPPALVENSLKAAPREFTLGARRPGWNLPMNAGDCTLMADGEGITVIDRTTGEYRASTHKDWLEATQLIDAIDDIGVYWALVERGGEDESLSNTVVYWRQLFTNFSKHVQDVSPTAEHSPWLLEILQTIFGDRETIRNTHPFSFLICPQSPLIIEGPHTDAYLETIGWDIPVAIMPMPLMGGTGPGNMISMIIQGNCEILAMLCLIQAAAPGTPFIYAPALAVMNPRNGLYSAGAVENGLLNSAAIEMARYYQLPVEASGGGTDTFKPGIQASYERSLNMMLPVLSWPDLLVGAGLLGGSMILSLEQLLIDAEVFRMNKQAHHGIQSSGDQWLDKVIQQVGPGGNFIGEKSTLEGMRSGEWLIPTIGIHKPRSNQKRSGKGIVLEQVHEKVETLLKEYEPLPLSAEAEKELDRIEKKAKEI